jgi:transporter family protein
MNNWLTTAFIALVLFGLWGFFPKLAVNTISPNSAVVYGVIGNLAVGLLALKLVGFRPDVHPKGIFYAVLTGITGMLGTLFFFYSVKNGKVSVVASLTALYPLITIILAHFVLREPISPRQIAAMFLALVALYLFAA